MNIPQWLTIPVRKLTNGGEFIITEENQIINTDKVTHITKNGSLLEFHLVSGKSVMVYPEDFWQIIKIFGGCHEK